MDVPVEPEKNNSSESDRITRSNNQIEYSYQLIGSDRITGVGNQIRCSDRNIEFLLSQSKPRHRFFMYAKKVYCTIYAKIVYSTMYTF